MTALLNNDNKGYDNNTNPMFYLQNYLNKPINKMKWKYATTYELEKIIVTKLQEFIWV